MGSYESFTHRAMKKAEDFSVIVKVVSGGMYLYLPFKIQSFKVPYYV